LEEVRNRCSYGISGFLPADLASTSCRSAHFWREQRLSARPCQIRRPLTRDTCVGTEPNCLIGQPPALEQAPPWPADWDALVFPGLAAGHHHYAHPRRRSLCRNLYLALGRVRCFQRHFLGAPSRLNFHDPEAGNKNSNDVSTWVVALRIVHRKMLLSAPIATYVGPPNTNHAEHELLYHGAIRFSPNGSETEGIWLFKQNVQSARAGQMPAKRYAVRTE
jgi:hypothetical protein